MKKSHQKICCVVFVLILAFVLYRMVRGGSSYTLSPSIGSSDLMLTGSHTTDDPIDMTALPYQLKCVPGPQDTASPYTKSLTPGGYCGIQEFVRAQGDYQITGGIGESLLS
jgi:hypothetical protein